MKKIIRIITVVLLFVGLGSINQSYMNPMLTPAPQGTTISLTYTHWNVDGNMKVRFWGDPYPSGQEDYDDACPWYVSSSMSAVTCQCDIFYYLEGRCDVWSRASSEDPWVYDGCMTMNANNCTMVGSKVTGFLVDTRYLVNPT